MPFMIVVCYTIFALYLKSMAKIKIKNIYVCSCHLEQSYLDTVSIHLLLNEGNRLLLFHNEIYSVAGTTL
jgi:hypothetical protein